MREKTKTKRRYLSALQGAPRAFSPSLIATLESVPYHSAMYTHAPSFGRAQRFGLRPGSGAFLRVVPFAAGLRAVFWVHGRRVGAVSVPLYTVAQRVAPQA